MNSNTFETSYRVCLEMLSQRNYKILEKTTDSIICLKPNNEKMIVIFFQLPKLGTKSIIEILNRVNEMNIMHLLVVYKEDFTPSTKKLLSKFVNKKFELFCENELQFNITKHRLQPKFERLSDKEAMEFKTKYGIKFPVLRTDKPISKFYNYSKGDIIRIIRNDKTITYRIVKGN